MERGAPEGVGRRGEVLSRVTKEGGGHGLRQRLELVGGQREGAGDRCSSREADEGGLEVLRGGQTHGPKGRVSEVPKVAIA